MIYKYVLDISPGTGGLIDITKNDAASSLPDRGADGKLKLIQRERNANEYGAYFTVTKNEAFVTNIINRLRAILPEQFSQIFVDSLDAMEKAWAGKCILKSLCTRNSTTAHPMRTFISVMTPTNLSSHIVKIADTAIQEYENKWKAGITSVKNKIILPAGNVFNFSGVDVDSQGNMFTHVSFANGAEDVDTTQGNPNPTEKPMVGGVKPT